MEKEVLELIEKLESHKDLTLPDFKELPSVPLYMEQVVSYINKVVGDITGDEKTITPFMVNNYVKARIIKEPSKKKYSEEQLGYLIAISLLKDSLSMNEISLLIGLDTGVSSDKSKLYSFFKDMQFDLTNTAIDRLLGRLNDFSDRYKKDAVEDTAKAEEALRYSIGLIALRYAVSAAVSKRMSERLLEAVGHDVYGDKSLKIVETPRHKETERKQKISNSEAERLAAAKNELLKEQKKSQKKGAKK